MAVKFEKTPQGMKQVSPTEDGWTPGAEHQQATPQPAGAQPDGDENPSTERKKIFGIF